MQFSSYKATINFSLQQKVTFPGVNHMHTYTAELPVFVPLNIVLQNCINLCRNTLAVDATAGEKWETIEDQVHTGISSSLKDYKYCVTKILIMQQLSHTFIDLGNANL